MKTENGRNGAELLKQEPVIGHQGVLVDADFGQKVWGGAQGCLCDALPWMLLVVVHFD